MSAIKGLGERIRVAERHLPVGWGFPPGPLPPRSPRRGLSRPTELTSRPYFREQALRFSAFRWLVGHFPPQGKGLSLRAYCVRRYPFQRRAALRNASPAPVAVMRRRSLAAGFIRFIPCSPEADRPALAARLRVAAPPSRRPLCGDRAPTRRRLRAPIDVGFASVFF